MYLQDIIQSYYEINDLLKLLHTLGITNEQQHLQARLVLKTIINETMDQMYGHVTARKII